MATSSIIQRAFSGSGGLLYRVMGRLYLEQHHQTMRFGIILALSILSVLFVFSLPSPLRPRTSIGLMMMFATGAIGLVYVDRNRKQPLFSIRNWEPTHYALLMYLNAVLLSLVFTTTIQDSTPLKLFLSGVALFLLTEKFRPTEKHKALFIHSMGAVSVGIASLALLQIAFPDLMNMFAEEFLRGQAAYGITIEFHRGRLLHWGALVFIFPFFYTSTLLQSWRSRIWTTLYIVYGYFAILLAMVVANFRWTFLVFFAVSGIYGLYVYRTRLLSAKKLYYVGVAVLLTFIAGTILARVVFGYNLLDRFLLKDSHRDITESLGRITLYNQALTVFQAYPIFGAGFGNYYSVVWPFPHQRYYSVFDQFEPYPVPIAAHNEFFTVLAETGALGFISYLFLFYFIGKRIFLRMIYPPRRLLDRLFAVTLASSYAAICLYTLFENMYPQNIAFLLLIGAIAHSWISTTKTPS